MSAQRKAVIVGAGIAGLATAIALEKAGWRVALLERGERLRGDDSGILLRPNAIRALRALGLGLALDAIATPVTGAQLRHSDGRVLVAAEPETPGRPVIRTLVAPRADLIEALVAALGDRVQVHTGITATHIDLVHPAAGDRQRRWQSDLVVGADGIGSAVRAGVDATSKVRGTAQVAFQAIIPAHRGSEISDAGGETRGSGGRRFLFVPMGKRGIYWMAVVRGGLRPEPANVRHELLARWFGDWHDPIGELINNTRPEEIAQTELSQLQPLPRHFTHIGDTSGAALVGDAAHGLPPDRGLGGGLALEDAVTLGVSLTGRSVADGLRRYETERRLRVVKLFRAAHRMDAVFGSRGKLPAAVRNRLARATGEHWFGRGTPGTDDWRAPEPG